MRIGTWNLAGRWDGRHLELLLSQDCDVWLLTEVNDRASLPGYGEVRTEAEMARRRRWAAIFSRAKLDPTPDPHPATAAAVISGVTVWCSVLPWRSCGAGAPWVGRSHAERTRAATEMLLAASPSYPLVWGGDWNHALDGKEYSGSIGGRTAVQDAVLQLALTVPTARLGHRIQGLLSIDHIGIPENWFSTATRVVAEEDGTRLSDHDLYVVSVDAHARDIDLEGTPIPTLHRR
jgi:endonuclease/exonuclease/phosphatase family metal-dependent hydrolase